MYENMNDVLRDIRSHASINVFITEYRNKNKKCTYDYIITLSARMRERAE